MNRDTIYVGGKWIPSTGEGSIDVVNPTTCEVIGCVPDGSAKDVNLAVDAAVDAFPEWSTLPPSERRRILCAICAGMEQREEELARLISAEVGTPLKVSRWMQARFGPIDFRAVIQALDEMQWEEQLGSTLVVREAIGVVAAITPWNFPLHQITAKLGAAFAAGCTVVLKPSELAPLTAYLFAEIVHDSGLPAGVFNMVSGYGPGVGEALVAHPKIDMVSFTGSNEVGKEIFRVAADNVKRVALELGGKSANLVLDDADLTAAVKTGVANAFRNSGQTCAALTRMLVPRTRLAEAEAIAATAAQRHTMGDPLDDSTKLGPLVSAEQHARVRAYIRSGIEQGAKLVTGGLDDPALPDTGYFVAPTVFSDVTAEMTIAQEEIFGPVLSIMPYDTEEEAITIANGTVYGLAAAVWSADNERASSVARRLRSGLVTINAGEFNASAPFGGYKQSGIGREGGKFGLNEYLEIKSIQR